MGRYKENNSKIAMGRKKKKVRAEVPQLEGEKWHQVEDYEYWISNKGRLRGMKGLIKTFPNKNTGLQQGMVWRNQKCKLLNIQHWVAQYFLPPKPDEEMTVRHISSDYSDNSVENLTWGYQGRKKNEALGIVTGGKKPKRGNQWRYIIKQYTLGGFCFATYVGFGELERLGFKRISIVAQSNGKYPRDSYKGYRFKVTKTLVKNKQEEENYAI